MIAIRSCDVSVAALTLVFVFLVRPSNETKVLHLVLSHQNAWNYCSSFRDSAISVSEASSLPSSVQTISSDDILEELENWFPQCRWTPLVFHLSVSCGVVPDVFDYRGIYSFVTKGNQTSCEDYISVHLILSKVLKNSFWESGYSLLCKKSGQINLFRETAWQLTTVERTNPMNRICLS